MCVDACNRPRLGMLLFVCMLMCVCMLTVVCIFVVCEFVCKKVTSYYSQQLQKSCGSALFTHIVTSKPGFF